MLAGAWVRSLTDEVMAARAVLHRSVLYRIPTDSARIPPLLSTSALLSDMSMKRTPSPSASESAGSNPAGTPTFQATDQRERGRWPLCVGPVSIWVGERRFSRRPLMRSLDHLEPGRGQAGFIDFVSSLASSARSAAVSSAKLSRLKVSTTG